MKSKEVRTLVQDAICTLTNRQSELKAGRDNPLVQVELARLDGQISALMDVDSAMAGDAVCLRLLAERGE